VYQHESYRIQAAYAQHQIHQSRSQFRSIATALRLYRRARTGALWFRLWSTLWRKPYRLLALSQVESSASVTGRRFLGTRCVPIDRIRGSEGRSGDFDLRFRPLQSHSRERWVSLLVAAQMGAVLPPVTLVQVQDVYFVIDGHHRISVAKALGQSEVDAEVTAWELASPAPALLPVTVRRPAHQPA
jgi:hypothetical protein